MLFVSKTKRLDFDFTSLQLMLSAVWRPSFVLSYFTIVQIIFLIPFDHLAYPENQIQFKPVLAWWWWGRGGGRGGVYGLASYITAYEEAY